MRSSLGRLVGIWACVAGLYIVAHALTAFVITPLQARLFPDVTTFASLLYLPHGVRLLAAWLWRWRAFPGLVAGPLLSEYAFTDDATLRFLEPVLLESILVGALSAYLVLEGLRLLGVNAYAGRHPRLNWQQLFLIGIVSSLVNSIGQTIVFGGFVVPEEAVLVLVFYAIGDIFGLFATMLLAVFAFCLLRGPKGDT